MARTGNETLWEWRELCRATGLDEIEGPNISGVSIDSRTLSPGDLFVALRGDPGPRFHTSVVGARDGHDFVGAAANAGASGAMVHRDIDTTLPLLRVADTLDGLWDLARFARTRCHGDIVAITGSSGKTTAKDFLAVMLEAHAAEGSFNNFWGVPVSLARMP
ncbi:MAG: UDP-N-acetylmuramoyl-tripeptide--D-alanyl-D-alanine ligase, partial [Gammaproteobacteria bacterium]